MRCSHTDSTAHSASVLARLALSRLTMASTVAAASSAADAAVDADVAAACVSLLMVPPLLLVSSDFEQLHLTAGRAEGKRPLFVKKRDEPGYLWVNEGAKTPPIMDE